jgi:4a-hydroxytetrahydrobiopterin dehydratase
MAVHLSEKRCVACEGGTPPMPHEEAQKLMAELHADWELEETEIKRRFKFKDFKEAMAFVNRVADIAESEGHHPDIKISYAKVKIELTTHAIKGLSENDFIVAAKIDQLLASAA